MKNDAAIAPMTKLLNLPDAWRLDIRTGLPEPLKILLEQYPREGWRSHPNMGALTRFWLSRHANFRHAGELLHAKNKAYLEGTLSGEAFLREMGPGLNALLQGLTEHHTIEDQHYFPQFMALEPRLATGFELLDHDHHALHDAMNGVVETGNAVLNAEPKDDDRARGEAFVAANETLIRFLERHLEDEEDLVVPLILDRNTDRPL